MGCVLSCLNVADSENTEGHGACIRCLTMTQHCYDVLFQRGEVPIVPSSMQEATLQSGSVNDDGSISDTYRAPPRPLAYDDPRCSMLHNEQVAGNKASSQFNLEFDSLRKQNGNRCSQSSLKLSSNSKDVGVTYMFSSLEEDECPTCLEEYTLENPRIILQCSHHYHLSCIYEWKERSESCPVCGKVMLFEESSD